MGRRSPDSPDAVEYKIDKYRDSRHRSPRSPSMEKRRYDRSDSPAPIKARRSRRSRSYDSPDRRRGRKHVRRQVFCQKKKITIKILIDFTLAT